MFWDCPQNPSDFGGPQKLSAIRHFWFWSKSCRIWTKSASFARRPRSNLGVLEPGVAGLDPLCRSFDLEKGCLGRLGPWSARAWAEPAGYWLLMAGSWKLAGKPEPWLGSGAWIGSRALTGARLRRAPGSRAWHRTLDSGLLAADSWLADQLVAG